MTIVPTKKWIVMLESEDTLDKTHFLDDDDLNMTRLLEQMRKDALLGGDMIKGRMEAKRKDNEKTHGPVPEEAKAALKDKLYSTQSRTNPEL